ncbi:MAG TPA: radical SAM protein [Desulfobacterales bacterium]|nr:radical SAM protein [Desulfobacterales bacterium]
MEVIIGETESLCPECLRRVHAQRVAEGDDVYLRKICPVHGEYRVIIWRGGVEAYIKWGQKAEEGGGIKNTFTDIKKGCPYDCGPCPAHTGGVCIALIEVTHRCNINCPICFANSDGRRGHEPDLKTIEDMYRTLLDSGGPYPVQLSGGEPTMRDDLPEIVAIGKRMGFDNIQINTNGIRLAEDVDYLTRLKESGASIIYLQFDGITDDVYRITRGMALMDVKLQVLENCAEIGLGVVLVPVLIPKVNDHQIGEIIQFAKTWMPTVRGVHFQPISYFGRYPWTPKDEDRITMPEVVRAIEEQTEGEIRVEDFKPRRSKEAYCAFAGLFILADNGKLVSTFRRDAERRTERPPEAVRRFLRTYWTSPGVPQCRCESGICFSSSLDWISDEFFDWVKAHCLTISGMPFQDVWNIDLERLKGCCIHVVTSDHRLIPFCAYYLTSKTGRRLYP